VNKVTLQGNLARDLDYKELGGDKALARGLLAVSRYGRGREGRDLVRIALWGKQAVNAVRYLEKGSSVSIVGRLRSSSTRPGTARTGWTPRWWSKRSSISVGVRTVPLLRLGRERPSDGGGVFLATGHVGDSRAR
jgi:single-strand DNA-binding protein